MGIRFGNFAARNRPRPTADAPVLKTRAGISARGRKLKNPYTHIVLSWPEGAEAPAKAGDAVGCRQRARQPRSRPPPLRGLRRAHGHELPARPRRGQPHRPRDRPGRQPRQGRHAQAEPLGRAIRAQPRRHRHVRVSNGARRGRPAAASRAAAARPACRASWPARSPRPCPGGRRRGGPPDGRLHPPVRRPTSARGGHGCSNGRAATCGVSGPLKTSGSSAGDANGEPAMPRGPRRTLPAAPPLSRRAVRRSASCAPTAPASASSCDAATGPNARRSRAASDAPWPASPPARPASRPPTSSSTRSSPAPRHRPESGSARRRPGRPSAGRASSRPRPSSSARRRRATAPQRQHAAAALAVQLELGVGNRPPPGAIEPNRTLPCAPPHRPAAGRVARASRVRMTAGAKETTTRFLSLRTSGGGPQRAGCNVARSRPPTVHHDGARCRRARCTR